MRRYPQGGLFGNPIGYSFITQGTSGFERSENATLTGEKNEFVSIIDQIRGQQREGNDIVTTLDAAAQQLATDQLEATGRPGAVVAIEPSDRRGQGDGEHARLRPEHRPRRIRTSSTPPTRSVLHNRAIQGALPAGLDVQGRDGDGGARLRRGDAGHDLNGASPQEFSGVDLANAGGEQFGDIDMRTALTNSVNTYFAQVGEDVGADTLLEYMDRFGFGKDPELELPDDQKAAERDLRRRPARAASSRSTSGFDIGRVAIGQGGEEGQVRRRHADGRGRRDGRQRRRR